MNCNDMSEVYIVSALRTPIGSFGGMFAQTSAIELGQQVVKAALDQTSVDPADIDEVYLGNVVSANLGQAPARQVAIGAGIPNSVPCTTINKVCSSGLKSVMIGAQQMMLGYGDLIMAGGMENMSQIPYYVPKARFGYKYGSASLVDGLEKDGLIDVYDQCAMGQFADDTAAELSISREDQDAYAIRSYTQSKNTTDAGVFTREIAPVSVKQRKGDPLIIKEDEEYKRVKFEKIPQLRPAFTKEGTVTAANASTINDGASAILLASEAAVKKYNLVPIARIVSFADAAHKPSRFTTAPTLAAPLSLDRAQMDKDAIDFYEVNEAFAVVPLAFGKMLEIPIEKVNVHGGAVSLGHPLGASGARILTTLTNVLQTNRAQYGMATICNGGGGASAMIIENLRK